MLRSLSIKNFAIIDDLFIDFKNGMTVLTGETGAGKSIIIDSISMLLGKRANYDFVRTGEAKAHISGEFEITNQKVIDYLNEYEIEFDGTLIIDRTLYKEGRSNIRVNGVITPLSVVKDISEYLVDIHSQHESAAFLNKKGHINLIDRFIGTEQQHLLAHYQSIFKELSFIKKELASFEEKNDESLLEIYQYQLDEIESAGISEDEENNLKDERDIVLNYEKIDKSVNTCIDNLSGNQKVLDLMYEIKEEIETLANYKDDFKEYANQVSDIYYQLEDIASTIGNTSFDSAVNVNIDEIEGRLFEIQRLKMKYGGSFDSLEQTRNDLNGKVEAIINKEVKIDEYTRKIGLLTEKCQEIANKLSSNRQEYSQILKTQVETYLKKLYMPNCEIIFSVTQNKEFNKNGIDNIETLVKTNVGEDFKQLSKVISGGELSRLMLSLKAVLIKCFNISTIVFDEIDSGVSGKVGTSFGEVMSQISKDTQVLTITHLPNVAALADNHYHVSKVVEDKKTNTIVSNLEFEERAYEIASMISSETVTPESIEYAKKMLA